MLVQYDDRECDVVSAQVHVHHFYVPVALGDVVSSYPVLDTLCYMSGAAFFDADDVLVFTYLHLHGYSSGH